MRRGGSCSGRFESTGYQLVPLSGRSGRGIGLAHGRFDCMSIRANRNSPTTATTVEFNCAPKESGSHRSGARART